TRAHDGVDGDGVLAKDVLVERGLLTAERRPIALRIVERIVDPLRHREKLRRSVDDEPTDVDTEATDVAKKRAEHFGDAASAGGRVDVPNGARPQELAHGHCQPFDGFDACASDELDERCDRPCGNLRLLHCSTGERCESYAACGAARRISAIRNAA